MSNYSQVTAVVVNWNKKRYVLDLLDSLLKLDADELTIVVVDNASTDGSVEAIRQHTLPVILLENAENLGGTGGFNTGIRFALDNLRQRYIWLLDNDAEVAPVTLQKLVQAMEKEHSIGVAGSCILSPEDRELIVEAGGFVDFVSGTWKPNRRYEPYAQFRGRQMIEEVDYVPACSALLRTSVVLEVGKLDERYFLHWDDIDFCGRVRRSGYRVVSVLDSPAYHGAEKGHSPVTLYYDFRNALLYFGKYARGVRLVRAYSSILANFMTAMVYLWTLGRKANAKYLACALHDFLSCRFGRASMPPGELFAGEQAEDGGLDGSVLASSKKIVVFAVGSYDEVVAALRSISKVAPKAFVAVAVAAERAEAYRLAQVSELIVFDLFRDGIRQRLATAASLIGGRFDFGILAGGEFTIPYAFLVRKNLDFNYKTGKFKAAGVSRSSLWKVFGAIVLGRLLMVALFFPVLAAGKRTMRSPS